MNDLSHAHPTPPADAIVDISSDPARLDIGFIHHALATQTYWAKDIPRVTLMRAIAHSLCFGAYATQVEGGAAVDPRYASLDGRHGGTDRLFLDQFAFTRLQAVLRTAA